MRLLVAEQQDTDRRKHKHDRDEERGNPLSARSELVIVRRCARQKRLALWHVVICVAVDAKSRWATKITRYSSDITWQARTCPPDRAAEITTSPSASHDFGSSCLMVVDNTHKMSKASKAGPSSNWESLKKVGISSTSLTAETSSRRVKAKTRAQTG